jgi:hypothetical protein
MDNAHAAWQEHAEALSRWAWDRFVIRTHAWGAYTPPGRRGQPYTRRDGTTDTVPASYTAKGTLTPDVLARHFRGARPEHVIGLHSTSPDNTCRAARVDIDAHGPGGNDPAANLKAALAWYARLAGLGFRPLLYASNAPPGQGGYHLAALFSEPVPAPRAFAFLRWLTDDHAAHGLAVRPELFPKQPAIPEGGFGNWLRLVGRHHTRDYWPEVWDGAAWLVGADAVGHVLALAGDRAGLIPAGAKPKVKITVQIVPVHHGHHHQRGSRRPSLDDRVRRYMSKLPNLGEGQGRDDVAYAFACWLLRDLGLGEATALRWLAEWDSANSPPKGEGRLQQIMQSALTYGKHAIVRTAGGAS